MKKALIALALIVVFATTSFASVSFLTAPGIGEGKIGVLGFYGTNHVGPTSMSGGDPTDLSTNDLTNLGIRGCYGVMPDLDVLAAYSFDTLPNVKKLSLGDQVFTDFPGGSVKQLSANSLALGAKYTVLKETKDIPVDIAVAVGYEQSVQKIRASATGYSGDMGTGQSAMILGGIVSKKIDNMVPYGALAYKALTMNKHRLPGIQKWDAAAGSAIALNLGLMYGIADNMAIAGEYNLEMQSWSETKQSGMDDGKTRAYHDTVSGISLGFAYMF